MTSSIHDIRLKDPLSEVTRKERRSLLATSIISITIVTTSLLPTKVEQFGIEFTQANRDAVLHILALVTIYFLVAFFIYAISDFLAWRLSFFTAYREIILSRRKQAEEETEKVQLLEKVERGEKIQFSQKPAEEMKKDWDDAVIMEAAGKIKWLTISSAPVSLLRAFFEFLFPLGLGIYALILLWRGP